MSGTFHGINLSSLALRNFQRAIDTAGHNIANVGTTGYSRQRVNMSSLTPLSFYSIGRHALGQGATIGSITRARDIFLDARSREISSDLGKAGAMAQAIQSVEIAFGEPGETGISAALGQFFDAWSTLGSRPDDPAARLQVQQSGLNLTDRVRNAYGSMSDEVANSQTTINNIMGRINDLGAQISELNTQIRAYNGSAGDLLDQRDQAVAELSSLVDVRVSEFGDGSYAVYAAGFTLVDGAGANDFPSTYNAANQTVTRNGVDFRVRSGALAGQMSAITSLQSRMASLDTLANTLRTSVNTPHANGITANGTTGILFFGDQIPQTGAIDFSLSASVAADANNIAAGTTNAPGDGGLAHAIAQIRDTNIAGLGNKTFNSYYENLANSVASEVSYWGQQSDIQASLADQAKSQIESISGVSIDDEMSDMMRYQRSYQAAAKAIQVFDEMAQDVIAMLRR